MNADQRVVARRVDDALKQADEVGLVLRVYDGAILLAPVGATRRAEYDQDKGLWEELYAIQVGRGMDADGGAGA